MNIESEEIPEIYVSVILKTIQQMKNNRVPGKHKEQEKEKEQNFILYL